MRLSNDRDSFKDGQTALIEASKWGHLEIVKMLEAKVKETQATN